MLGLSFFAAIALNITGNQAARMPDAEALVAEAQKLRERMVAALAHRL